MREPFLWPLDLLKLPSDILRELEVVVSKPELRESVRIVLPAGLSARAGLGSVRQTRVTDAELVRQLESMRLDPNNAWELSGDEASLFVSLRPGQRVTTAVIAAPARADAPSRVSFLTRSGDEVMGGSELLMRPHLTNRMCTPSSSAEIFRWLRSAPRCRSGATGHPSRPVRSSTAGTR